MYALGLRFGLGSALGLVLVVGLGLGVGLEICVFLHLGDKMEFCVYDSIVERGGRVRLRDTEGGLGLRALTIGPTIVERGGRDRLRDRLRLWDRLWGTVGCQLVQLDVSVAALCRSMRLKASQAARR